MDDEAPRVLLVEDDRTLARGLVMNLELEGFRVLHAPTGEEGLELALRESPDLVVLDLMLPGLDGFELVTQLRGKAQAVPVLVLSARSETRDKVEALRLGADAYLTKPFRLAELVAHIRAGLRRPAWREAPAERWVRFGEVEVSLSRRMAWRGGTEVALTPREFDLLVFLAARPGRVYSREHLVDTVWGRRYEGTARTVDNFVRSLRVKLEADPGQPRHFVTVRGAGYRFEL